MFCNLPQKRFLHSSPFLHYLWWCISHEYPFQICIDSVVYKSPPPEPQSYATVFYILSKFENNDVVKDKLRKFKVIAETSDLTDKIIVPGNYNPIGNSSKRVIKNKGYFISDINKTDPKDLKETKKDLIDNEYYAFKAKVESAGNLLSLFASAAKQLKNQNNANIQEVRILFVHYLHLHLQEDVKHLKLKF